jgi:tetratricopeptide (TPR) repeat protein
MGRFRFSFAAIVVALAFNSSGVFAQAASQSACDPAPARATSVQGTVEVRRVGDTQWRALNLNDALCPGDQIRVQERSRADIQLLDQSVLRLNANSTITVEAPKERTTGVVDLVRGAVHFFSRGPRSLEVKTPYTIAGVRGTEFFIDVDTQRAQMIVYEGTVVADSPAGSLTLRDGQSGVAAADKPPVAQVVARPRDAVHWALYYPPVIDVANAPGYRAQTLLAVGAVDEARSDIGRALQAAPNDANALSLQSIMAVVQGDKDQGLQLAQAAVAADPKSATALISRSYAEQARFDLNAARASAQQATQLEPNNALAWARLAELHSAFGDLKDSLAAARRAVEINPNLSRTQTVLGFAHLTSIETRDAKAAFEKAISLDQADPLPRLGMGLALIREGDLGGGSRQIEVAASLDPNNALVRSYLGKAYYEEKRSPLDEREFGVAKQLDPKDPTPWFYDAIAKQTTNRPVEALESIEKAQELNQNRAVYRSQLLLDSDAAARAASQSRVYSELGFGQLALAEGWRSLNLDPTNFSAHRFLADSYSTLPRHQIARVSELLQSQLLQPVNNTPLQPRLAESNLFLIGSGGPGVASFNEFNPLFNRNGATGLLSGFVGEQDTAGGEAVVAGIAGKAGFSVGVTKFQTDGFRQNNDQDDELANAFLQYDFTPQTSVQAEYRKRKTEAGDLQQKFFPENFVPGLRNTQDIETVRLGGRHTFSPSSILLASFVRQDGQFNTVFDDPAFFTTLDIPQDSTGVELQHLWRTARFNLRSGVGYAKIEGQINAFNRFDLGPPIGLIEESSTTQTEIEHTNAYAYADIRLLPTLTAVVGASYDSLKGDFPGGDQDEVNPKLGLIWQVAPSTTVRAAAFQVVTRTLIADQTLEPTQVAGFNQFYDDGNLTKSRRYGAAIDHKFARNIYGGAELARRDMDVTFLDSFADPVNPPARTVDWEEDLARAYLFWTPTRSLALRAEYILERFDRDEAFTANVKNLDIHRVPLGVTFFHPSGFTAGITATYWEQKGEFEQLTFPPSFVSGSDQFWLVDAAVSYRLPKRYGLITLGAKNLFDEQFNAFDIDPFNSTIQPKRMVFLSATLALP